MNVVDTNILIYVNDPRDPAKQTIAASLISSLTDGVLICYSLDVDLVTEYVFAC